MTVANMEDRRTAIAIFLCIVIVMVYSEVFLAPVTRPQPTPQATEQLEASQTKTVQTSEPAASNEPTAPANSLSTGDVQTATSLPTEEQALSAIPSPAEINQAGVFKVNSNFYHMELSKLGGRIAVFKLLKHKAGLEDDEPLNLIEQIEGMPLPLGVELGNFNDSRVSYQLSEVAPKSALSKNEITVPADRDISITLMGALANGATLKKVFTFSPSTYLFQVDVSFEGLAPNANNVWLNWYVERPDPETVGTYDSRGFTGLDADSSLETLLFSEFIDVEKDLKSQELGSLRWISLGDKYFMGSLIPLEGYHQVKASQGKNYIGASMQGAPLSFSAKVFVGPKYYDDLRALDTFQLHRNVDLGVFSFLAHPLMGAIRFFYGFLGNWGLAIVLLTLIIKALFLPLTKTSMRSMKAMQDIQPEMKALRERIKDPTQLNKEVMALYKKRGVNPMGGCLPMLIQLPVFLGLYNALLYSIELRHAPFALWVTDLSAPEGLEILGINVPVMIILMGISMAWQQWTTPAADPQQKKVMMFMPIVFTGMFIIFPFPAGLVLYWLINNIISVVQQVTLRNDKSASPEKATVVSSALIFGGAYILTII